MENALKSSRHTSPQKYDSKQISYAIGYFDFLVSGQYWKLKLMILGLLFAFVCAPPIKENIHFENNYSYWPTVENQIAHPFQAIDAHPKSHAANKSFRLTVPLLAKLFHLDRRSIYIVQVSTILIMMWVILTLAFRITENKLYSALFLFAFIPLYPLICSYQEATGHLDAFGYCFILLAMVPRQKWLIFLFCTCALWCDERALISSLLVFLWWYLNDMTTFPSRTKLLRIPNQYAFAVMGSWVAYIALRLVIMKTTPLHIAMEKPDLSILPQYIRHIPMLVFFAFGALWLFPIIGILYLIKFKEYLFAAAFVLPMLMVFIISSMVWDFSRSISFLLPAFFISLIIVRNYLNESIMRYLFFFVFIVAVIFPCVHFDSQIHYIPGLFYNIIEYGVDKLYHFASI
jgi:hypothetical protein